MSAVSLLEWGRTLTSLGEALQDAGGGLEEHDYASMTAHELITLLAANRIRFSYLGDPHD